METSDGGVLGQADRRRKRLRAGLTPDEVDDLVHAIARVVVPFRRRP
jgi:hypothetical protein